MPLPTESPTIFETLFSVLAPAFPSQGMGWWLDQTWCQWISNPILMFLSYSLCFLALSSLALMLYSELWSVREVLNGRDQLPGGTVAFHDTSSNQNWTKCHWPLWRHMAGIDGFSFCPLKGNSGMHNVLHQNKTQMPCFEKSDPTKLKITDLRKKSLLAIYPCNINSEDNGQDNPFLFNKL